MSGTFLQESRKEAIISIYKLDIWIYIYISIYIYIYHPMTWVDYDVCVFAHHFNMTQRPLDLVIESINWHLMAVNLSLKTDHPIKAFNSKTEHIATSCAYEWIICMHCSISTHLWPILWLSLFTKLVSQKVTSETPPNQSAHVPKQTPFLFRYLSDPFRTGERESHHLQISQMQPDAMWNAYSGEKRISKWGLYRNDVWFPNQSTTKKNTEKLSK